MNFQIVQNSQNPDRAQETWYKKILYHAKTRQGCQIQFVWGPQFLENSFLTHTNGTCLSDIDSMLIVKQTWSYLIPFHHVHQSHHVSHIRLDQTAKHDQQINVIHCNLFLWMEYHCLKRKLHHQCGSWWSTGNSRNIRRLDQNWGHGGS